MRIFTAIDPAFKTWQQNDQTSIITAWFIEDKYEENEDYRPSAQELLDEEIELAGILTDIVFKNQFTIGELLYGVDDKYLYDKLREAVFGEKPKEQSEGNEQGKWRGMTRTLPFYIYTKH